MTGAALPQLLRPRALRPGDLVVIAALSGPLHAAYETDLEQAEVVLERMGLRVRRAPLLEAGRRHWWSAAPPAEIAKEFNTLLRDPEVRAIVAHGGTAEARSTRGRRVRQVGHSPAADRCRAARWCARAGDLHRRVTCPVARSHGARFRNLAPCLWWGGNLVAVGGDQRANFRMAPGPAMGSKRVSA